ncbi:ribulose-1,5-bisphosphate carboxylase/oxygenase large subunit [Rhizobiales bacterium GAS188]|nr:ribulose-1,5-bisphosphate carboxylase/oxygenase large subunit [Rhizobiales bacterium GAS188]
MKSAIEAVYHISCPAEAAEERARAVAVEQSVEMPVAAIEDERVLGEIVGEVRGVRELRPGLHEARIGLNVETTGHDAGQLINMLFGNASLLEDVILADADFPAETLRAFGGPRQGFAELRARGGVQGRALTASALKPQGMPAAKLADLARRFAEGGVDYIKDDHGLADQAYSPFAERVAAVAAAMRQTGGRTRYVPSLTGDLDALKGQIRVARDNGVDTVMLAPMVSGLSNLQALVRQNADMAFLAHPSLGGAARIAPPLLIGKLFRLFGAGAVVFPNYGGRFGYSRDTCRALAHAALDPWGGLAPSVPVPAGGMTLARVPELLDFYGAEVMLLIGGNLLAARERLVEETAAFVASVERYFYG